MDIDIDSLVGPTRSALAITCVVFAIACARSLRGRDAEERAGHAPALRALGVWLLALGLPALVLGLATFTPLALTLLPIGVGVGLVAMVAGLFHAPMRRAFDALDDGQVRTLLGYRAIFGAFLFAGAALGLLPPVFAWTAGLGDLVVGWLAHAVPGSLGRDGSRGWRLLVHGVGLLDLVEVVILAMAVVRPWVIEQGSLGPPMVLPWIGVPLMLALNLHGLRRAIADGSARQIDEQSTPQHAAPERIAAGTARA